MRIDYIDKIKYNSVSKTVESSLSDDISMDEINLFIKSTSLYDKLINQKEPVYWLDGLLDEFNIINRVKREFNKEINENKIPISDSRYGFISEFKLSDGEIFVFYHEDCIMIFDSLFMNDKGKIYLEENMK